MATAESKPVGRRLAEASGVAPLRVALLTPEFVTEYQTGGGLGNYVNRLAQALRQSGHAPEVFTVSQHRSATLDHGGIPVHRVYPGAGPWAERAGRWAKRLGVRAPKSQHSIVAARALAGALREREREAPFDLVQSADYFAAGLFVERNRRRKHVIRCCWEYHLWTGVDGLASSFDGRLRAWLERRAMRRADAVYAPSQFMADHFRKTYGIELAVVRPPMFQDHVPPAEPPAELPPRFLCHFGMIGRRKGSEWLAEALSLAWREEPDLRMVWAGMELQAGLIDSARRDWGERAGQVTYLGAIPKPQLYAVLRRADAVVLPSLVDNLPNTVIESLSLGLPLVGTAGASIDELVDDGVNGRLVPAGYVPGLARALVAAWRGELPRGGVSERTRTVLAEMEPATAVERLLELAGVRS